MRVLGKICVHASMLLLEIDTMEEVEEETRGLHLKISTLRTGNTNVHFARLNWQRVGIDLLIG